MDGGWCTIESDPAVFTEMIEQFGVQGVAVEELIAADEESLKAVGNKVFGLVLLFKWKPSTSGSQPQQQQQTTTTNSGGENVYFARQIVSNACATQAIVNIVLNHPDKIALGPEMTQFLDFTAPLDSNTRGEMIGQSATMRTVHNSFARSNVFSFEDKKAKEDDDVYHFIAYTVKDGKLMELDGLQESPICIDGDASEGNWSKLMSETVVARMAKISAEDKSGESISFSLMAVVDDPIKDLQTQLETLTQEGKPTGYVEGLLADKQAQREKGKWENKRRRHNYIPAMVELLKCLAEKGKLENIVEKGKTRYQERRNLAAARTK